MIHRLILTALSAGIVSSMPARAEKIELVCNGVLGSFDEQGDIDGVTLRDGVLIQIGDDVQIMGSVVFDGTYELTSVDKAMFAFDSVEFHDHGYLNRYSGDLNLFECKDKDCEGSGAEFSGSCEKRERKF